jgi:hypothetical protein
METQLKLQRSRSSAGKREQWENVMVDAATSSSMHQQQPLSLSCAASTE